MKTFEEYLNENYYDASRFRREELVSKILTPGRLSYMSDRKLLQILRAAHNHKKYKNVKIEQDDKELRNQHRYDVVGILTSVDVQNIEPDQLEEIIEISRSKEGEIPGLEKRKPRLKGPSMDKFRMSQRKFFRKKTTTSPDEDEEARQRHISSGPRIKDDSNEYRI